MALQTIPNECGNVKRISELDELMLANATTIQKAHGSEYVKLMALVKLKEQSVL